MNEEALRCLLCAKPGCSLACPVRTPVPVCMRLYIDGRIDEAGEILFRNNPLSAITALICDWERTCMGHCVLNRRNMPVRWHEIEYEISWEYLRRKHLVRSAGDKGRISVVGAGPAGIAAAIWLAGNGCEVHVYDDNPRIGGVLRYGIRRQGHESGRARIIVGRRAARRRRMQAGETRHTRRRSSVRGQRPRLS